MKEKYDEDKQPPKILKAQVEGDYLKAGVERSFFWELRESINTISTGEYNTRMFLST